MYLKVVQWWWTLLVLAVWKESSFLQSWIITWPRRLLLVRSFIVCFLLGLWIHHVTPFWPQIPCWKSAYSLLGVTLYVMCYFSLAAFKICHLSLAVKFCLSTCLLEFVLFGTLWVPWICMAASFPSLGKCSAIIYWHKFPAAFIPFLQFGLLTVNFSLLHAVPKVP